MVPDRGLALPGRRAHADAGLDNQLAFLDAALDYVADHTPRDTRDAYLEAVVTTWHNTDDPPTVVLRSAPIVTSRMTAAAHDRPWPRRRSWLGRVDELLGRPVSMRAMALLRVLVGPIVLLHLRPLLEDAWHGDTYRDVFHEPYASWYPELPRSGVRRDAVDRRARRRGDGRRAPSPGWRRPRSG